MPSYAVTRELLTEYGLTPSRRRGYVLAAPVIAHVLALEELGWTYERTSTTAGLATCSVRQMLRQQNKRIMARRAVAIMQIPLRPFLWKKQQHGHDITYRELACRCDLCRKAHSDYQKARRYRVNVTTRMVPAEPVRQRVQVAIDQGLTTKKRLHKAIGGSHRTITELMAGHYSMMRQPTVKRIDQHLKECQASLRMLQVDLCLICGWPVSEHQPYYVHIEPFKLVRQPPDPHTRRGLVTSGPNQNRYKRQADRLRADT